LGEGLALGLSLSVSLRARHVFLWMSSGGRGMLARGLLLSLLPGFLFLSGLILWLLKFWIFLDLIHGRGTRRTCGCCRSFYSVFDFFGFFSVCHGRLDPVERGVINPHAGIRIHEPKWRYGPVRSRRNRSPRSDLPHVSDAGKPEIKIFCIKREEVAYLGIRKTRRIRRKRELRNKNGHGYDNL
jgi:hypothetical protein